MGANREAGLLVNQLQPEATNDVVNSRLSEERNNCLVGGTLLNFCEPWFLCEFGTLVFTIKRLI